MCSRVRVKVNAPGAATEGAPEGFRHSYADPAGSCVHHHALHSGLVCSTQDSAQIILCLL